MVQARDGVASRKYCRISVLPGNHRCLATKSCNNRDGIIRNYMEVIYVTTAFVFFSKFSNLKPNAVIPTTACHRTAPQLFLSSLSYDLSRCWAKVRKFPFDHFVSLTSKWGHPSNSFSLCSLGDGYFHEELGSDDAHHSIGRNVSEEEISTTTVNQPGSIYQ